MADRDRVDGDPPVADALSRDEQHARGVAGQREAERIEKERQEAARRLAAARAQIAEFDELRGKSPAWALGSKKARQSSELLEGMLERQSLPEVADVEPVPGESVPSATGGPGPGYDRPDNRDAGREVLAAFAETDTAPSAGTDHKTDQKGDSRLFGGRSLRSPAAKAHPPREAEDAAPAPDRAKLSQDAEVTPPTASAERESGTSGGPSSSAPSRASNSEPGSSFRTRPRSTFSMNVDFKPRLFTRYLLTTLLVITIAATIYVGLTLRVERNTLNIGLSVTLAALTLLLYAVRMSAATWYLRVRGGLLEIKRGGRREVFDISSRFTPMEVIGQPGRRGWKVLMLRSDGMPQVIDSSMVDSQHFMDVLTQYRPDLAQPTR